MEIKLKRDPYCDLCPLHKTAEFVCLLGQGPIPSDIMIIGEAPGRREDASGKAFVGQAGQLLEDMLEEIGIYREEVFITNAVHCRPEENRTPRPREIAACRKWLNYEISKVKPKFILLLGNVPMQSVLGIKGIRKQRGKAVEKDGMVILPTFHPASILYDERMREPIEKDLRRFKEIIDFGGIPYERELNITTVDTWEKVDLMLDALFGEVSCDIETTCLYPWAREAKINTLGFGTESGEFVIPMKHRESKWTERDIEEILEAIDDKLDDCELIFHAGKFDLLWMKVHYKVNWRNDFDTMLAHYLLDENSLHDLEFLAQLYYGAHKWDISLEEKQNGPLKKLVFYHGHDLYHTRKVARRIKAELKKDPEVKAVFDHIMMPCSNLFVNIEHRGCFIDLTKMKDAEKFLRQTMAECEKRLSKWGNINWGSPQQVGQLLYGKLKIKCPMKTPKGGNSTAESALKQIDHPAVEDLLEFRGAKQQLSFFIEGWKPFIVHNRIHPSFKLHGTVTGRPSCEHPNFQQVPRDVRIRSLICSPSGYELVEIDLSQIELRIVAEISGESNMRKAFRDGIDIHWLTTMNELSRGAGKKDLIVETARIAKQLRTPPRYAEAIEILLEVGPDIAADIDPVWKELRKRAKAVNFGYCKAKGTKVTVPGGYKNIEDVKVGDWVYSYDDDLKLCLKKVLLSNYMGVKECYRVRWQGGRGNFGYLDLTGEDHVRLIDGSYKQVDKLKRGDRVLAVHRRINNGRNFLGITGCNRSQQESRIVFEHVNNWVPEHVHHIDGDCLNDRPENLEGLTASEHYDIHVPRLRRDINWSIVKRYIRKFGIMEAAKQLNVGYGLLRRRRDANNHWVKSVTRIGKKHTYEIEVEETGNFIANELCTHNTYGMWWRKFIIYARDNYDLKLTDQQAKESREAFFDAYRLENWHKSQRAYAQTYGFVKSLTGRKRRLPIARSREDTPARAEALRQAINSPVQSFASDLNLMVLLQLAKEFPPPLAYPVTTVHDSCLIEVREDIVEEFVHRAEAVMRSPELLKTFDITFTVPICGEAKIGPWGLGVSLKKWLQQKRRPGNVGRQTAVRLA